MADIQTGTFLFTDLVGSTSLSTSVSPEEADELRRTHFDLLRTAVTANGGVEVKNLGDGLMVVFGSATRAVAGAVAMQQGIDAHNRRPGSRLAVRIGISTGEVSAEDGDYFGDPVVEAARLCAVAEGGQVLISSLVRATLGRRAAYQLEPVGNLELKGLPDPVETWEVRWEPLSVDPAASVPLPARWTAAPVGSPGAAFVGRESELDLLGRAWKAAVAGERRVVLLSGEPGIGKTRLARETALRAAEEGAVVLFGACDEGLGAPYRPWIEALDHLVDHLPDDVLDELGTRRLSDLARVVPALRDRRPGLPVGAAGDAETERYLFYSAVVALLRATVSVGPVLLTIDDLQWADRQSLVLLRHVVAAPECRSLLLVATFRDADVGVDHPLADVLAALRREAEVSRLALSGLSDIELVSLLDVAAREPLGESGEQLAHALYRETDGNPFFAWEIMRHLSETGWALQDERGHWVGRDMTDLSLPDSVREVVGRRVARLGTEVTDVLAVASVLGADFSLPELAGAVGRDSAEVLECVERAEQSAVVRSLAPGQFRFGHAIIRHTLYDQLSPTRRALLHRQAAEALEALGPEPGRAAELARHWAAAVTLTDAGRAVRYSRQAGDEAMASLAPDQAAEHFRRALQLVEAEPGGEPSDRCELLCSLAEALCQSGDPSHVGTAMEAAAIAQRIGNTSLLVRAALIYYRVSSSAYDPQRCAVLEAALDAVGPGDSAERARLLTSLVLQLTFAGGRRALDLSHEALGIARRVGDRRLLMEVLANNHTRLWAVERGLAAASEAVALARELDDPAGMAMAAHRLCHDSIAIGDHDGAEEALGTFRQAVARFGRPDLRWILDYVSADWALLHGDLDEAEARTGAAWDYGQRTGQPGAFVVYVSQTMMLRWHQGRPQDALPLVAEAAQQDREMNLLRLGAGPGSSAQELRRAVEALPDDGAWLVSLAILAEQIARTDDVPLIETVYAQLRPHRHLFNKQGPQTRGPVAHTMALLAAAAGRRDDANSDFALAHELNGALRAPFYTARTQLDWARFLLSEAGDPANHRDDAEALLLSVRDAATRHGYAALQQRAGRLLVKLRS